MLPQHSTFQGTHHFRHRQSISDLDSFQLQHSTPYKARRIDISKGKKARGRHRSGGSGSSPQPLLFQHQRNIDATTTKSNRSSHQVCNKQSPSLVVTHIDPIDVVNPDWIRPLLRPCVDRWARPVMDILPLQEGSHDMTGTWVGLDRSSQRGQSRPVVLETSIYSDALEIEGATWCESNGDTVCRRSCMV